MGNPIKVLIVGDSGDDATLLIRALQDGGYDPVYQVVDTPDAMSDALDRQEWDLAISECSMPIFSGLDALKLLQEKDPDLSFILMTGQIDEETAVAAMKAGVHDYVLRSNLPRLIPVVERELRDTQARRRNRQYEQDLQESRERYRLVVETANEERKRADEALRQTTAELQAVFRVLPDLYCKFSADGKILQLLAGCPSDLHLSDENPLGKRIRDVSRTLGKQFQQAIEHVLQTRSLVVIEYPITQGRDKKIFEARFLPLLDDQVIAVVRNISERKQLEEMLQRISRVDGLTGIANRRLFDERLNNEWKRATRDSRPLSLIMCDVDFFKEYNDAYGHLLGDDCLKRVATILKNTAKRAGDLAARYGGDEYAIILPETDPEAAAALAEAVRSGVEDLEIENRKSPSMRVTISVGVATFYPEHDTSPVDLIAASDKALCEAKKSRHARAKLFLTNI